MATTKQRDAGKRGVTRGAGSGRGALTVAALRREAARFSFHGRPKLGKAQLIRPIGRAR